MDDIFPVWLGKEVEFRQFFSMAFFTDISFTLSFSNLYLPFLDVKVAGKDQKLHTELFTKNFDRNPLLCYKSWHPRNIVKSLPIAKC